jgi:hypothetical protein
LGGVKALYSRLGRDKRFKSIDQLRDVEARNLPSAANINVKIIMDHNITQAHDFSPGDFGMSVSELRRDSLSRFTKHGKLKQHCILIASTLEKIHLL